MISVVHQKSLFHSWDEAARHSSLTRDTGLTVILGTDLSDVQHASLWAQGALWCGPVVDGVAVSPLVLVLRVVVFGRCLSIDGVTRTGRGGTSTHDGWEASAPSCHARTQGEGGHLSARERALATDRVCTRVWELLASGRNEYMWLKPSLVSL